MITHHAAQMLGNRIERGAPLVARFQLDDLGGIVTRAFFLQFGHVMSMAERITKGAV